MGVVASHELVVDERARQPDGERGVEGGPRAGDRRGEAIGDEERGEPETGGGHIDEEDMELGVAVGGILPGESLEEERILVPGDVERQPEDRAADGEHVAHPALGRQVEVLAGDAEDAELVEEDEVAVVGHRVQVGEVADAVEGDAGLEEDDGEKGGEEGEEREDPPVPAAGWGGAGCRRRLELEPWGR